MNRKFLASVVASTAVAALVLGGANPALADEPPVVAPVLSVVLTPATLTLPAGDGVRDSDIVRVSSDMPTTATVRVLSLDRTVEHAVLPAVDFTDAMLTQDVRIQVAGIPAGEHLIEILPAGGIAVDVPLTVGSGEPRSVGMSLARSVIYTWKRSSAQNTAVRLSARDETGLSVPFVGRVSATRGTTTRTFTLRSSSGASAATTLHASKLAVGTWRVSATATAQGHTASANAQSLSVRRVAVTGVKLSRSESVVYPSKDGYRDSTKLSLGMTSTTGSSIPVTGTVTITRAGTTVKTWKLTSSKNWSRSWNGKVGSRIVEGRYVVAMSVKGPEGSTFTQKKSIVVKTGKLESRRYTATRAAASTIQRFVTYDQDDESYCEETRRGELNCIGYDAYYDDTLSVLGYGKFSMPSKVVSAQKYGRVKVRMRMNTRALFGAGAWGYGSASDPATRVTEMREGKTTAGWVTLPAGSRHVGVSVALGEYSFFYADTTQVEYTYKVMVR